MTQKCSIPKGDYLLGVILYFDMKKKGKIDEFYEMADNPILKPWGFGLMKLIGHDMEEMNLKTFDDFVNWADSKGLDITL